MKSYQPKSLRLVLTLALFFPLASQANVRLSVAGLAGKSLLADKSVVVSPDTITLKHDLKFGAAAFAELGLSRGFGIEPGALYLPDSITTHTTHAGVADVVTVTKRLFLPVILRFHFAPAFSIGGGGYYAASLEKQGGHETGYLGSARLSLPMSASSDLFFEGMYLGGLTNFAGVKNKAFVALVGLTFGGRRK